MVKSRGRSRPHSQRSSSADVELILECTEEELSPTQKTFYKKAQQEYNAVKKQIEQYKENNAVIEYLTVAMTTAEIEKIEAKEIVTVEEFISGSEITVTPVGSPQHFQAVSKKSTSKSQAKSTKASSVSTGLSKGRPQRKAAQAAKNLITIDDEEAEEVDVIVVNTEHGQANISGVRAYSNPQFQAGGTPSNFIPPNSQVTIVPVPQPPGGNILPYPTPQQFVAGTYGLGIKRGAGTHTEVTLPPPKKRAPNKKTEDDQMIQVPLDEYYYSKKEGDPAYREEKGEYRFKCWYCHKMLYNNLRIMMHMQGHIDSEKQQNLDLSDLTQCKHCYKQFDTPFEMQCHVEKVHQNNSNVLVCRICEKDHDNQTSLRQHMKASHNACEMPYICQLCNFRSSVYSDVVDHFKKRHDSSQYVMCLYCLKVFKVAFSKSSGWGLTQSFYQHIQKHQTKGNNKKCICCKLTFINKVDVKMHRQRDHLPNFRGAISGTAMARNTEQNNSEGQVMIKLPSDGKGGKLKSLNAPTVSKIQEIRGVKFNWVTDKHMCKECKMSMNSLDHFKKYVECSLCRYATTCSNAYAFHMMGYHSGNLESKLRSVPIEKTLTNKWFCLCGYSSSKGNSLANHLVICSKRTGYLNPPEQKFFEYDDEQEEFNPFEPYNNDETDAIEKSSPEKEIPSLFGALGLVRKQDHPGINKKDSPSSSSKDMSPVQLAESIVVDVLDNMFPAEAEAVRAINRVMKKVNKKIDTKVKETAKKLMKAPEQTDDIPPEFTGAQKWSTVKIADTRAPTKASVFLGSTVNKKDIGETSAVISKVKTDNLLKEASKEEESYSGTDMIQGDDGEENQTEKENVITSNETNPTLRIEKTEDSQTKESQHPTPDDMDKYESQVNTDTTTEESQNLKNYMYESQHLNTTTESHLSDVNMDTENTMNPCTDSMMEESHALPAQMEIDSVMDTEITSFSEADTKCADEPQPPLISEEVMETDQISEGKQEQVDVGSIAERTAPNSSLDEVEEKRASEKDMNSIEDKKRNPDHAPSNADTKEQNVEEGNMTISPSVIDNQETNGEKTASDSQPSKDSLEDNIQEQNKEDVQVDKVNDDEPKNTYVNSIEDKKTKPDHSPYSADIKEQNVEEENITISPSVTDDQETNGEKTASDSQPSIDSLEDNIQEQNKEDVQVDNVNDHETKYTKNIQEQESSEQKDAQNDRKIEATEKASENKEKDTKNNKGEENTESKKGKSNTESQEQNTKSSASESKKSEGTSVNRPSSSYSRDHGSSSRDRSHDSSHRSDSSRDQRGSNDHRRDDYKRNDQRHGENRWDDSRSYGNHRDNRHDNRERYDNRDRQHGGYDNRNWQGGHNRDNRYSGGHHNRRDERYGNNQRGGYRNDNYRGGYNRGRGGYQGGGYGGYHGGYY